MAQDHPRNEITRNDLSIALRRIPMLTTEDAEGALRQAGVPLAVEAVCTRRDDVHNAVEVLEALRFHLAQRFLTYFNGALWDLWAGQVTPSAFIRTLRGLLNPRNRKYHGPPYTELIRLTLARARGGRTPLRQDESTPPEIIEKAIAYEKRKVDRGRGGSRHGADWALMRLHQELMSDYESFTGRKPSAHLNKEGTYDGPYIRFVMCLFRSVADKAQKSSNALVKQVGCILAKQSAAAIRERWIRLKNISDLLDLELRKRLPAH